MSEQEQGPAGAELVVVEEYEVVIPNDDVCVSAIARRRRLGDEILETVWRFGGDWVELDADETHAVYRSTMDYRVKPYAIPLFLPRFDAGLDIEASMVEMAMRDPDDEIFLSGATYTRDLLRQLARERERREDEPSPLSVWLEQTIHGEIRSTAAEMLTALVMLLDDRAKRRPPILKAKKVEDLPPITDRDLADLAAESPEATAGWEQLHRFLSALITLTGDVVVVSVRTEHFDGDVYVQLCREDEGALTLEAVSDAYLEPPLSPDAITTLHELGWEDPPGDGLPNYVRFLEREHTAPGEVAAFLIQTLQRVYGTKPSDLHRFEPNALVRSMLRGDYGPQLAANPAMNAGRRGRLFLGLRFPGDIGD